MSEDASVNTGAVVWPEEDWAQVTVRRTQAKLHCWAAGDPGRRFDDLYNLICDPAFLVVAWQRVAGNAGSRTPGVDRATVAWIARRAGRHRRDPSLHHQVVPLGGGGRHRGVLGCGITLLLCLMWRLEQAVCGAGNLYS